MKDKTLEKDGKLYVTTNDSTGWVNYKEHKLIATSSNKDGSVTLVFDKGGKKCA